MLSVADEFLREHNSAIQPILFGQDYNDESWAICKSDILIKGEDADLIVLERLLHTGMPTTSETTDSGTRLTTCWPTHPLA